LGRREKTASPVIDRSIDRSFVVFISVFSCGAVAACCLVGPRKHDKSKRIAKE